MRNYVIVLLSIFLFSCATTKKSVSTPSIYWVNSLQVACVGVGPMQCLQVQKSENLQAGNWELFYSTINGFDFEPGYIYKLSVKEEKLNPANVPADGSSIKYTLVEVLEKRADKNALTQQSNVWVLESIKGQKVNVQASGNQKVPQLNLNVNEMKFTGNDGCNNIFGDITKFSNSRFEFGLIAGTKMACPNTRTPDTFNKAMNNVVKYKVENNMLSLLNDTGAVILKFRKQ